MPVSAPPASLWSPAETWSFNGVALSQPYWNIATLGGSRFALPAWRGSNYQVPYKAGQSQRAKFPDSRTLTLAMWIDGANGSPVDSYPPSDQRLAFNNSLQELREEFFQMNAAGSVQGQLQRNWYLTQGTAKLVTSTAMAEIASAMDLTMNGRLSAAFTVDFLLADPFFYGAQQSVACTGTATTITGLGEGIAGLGFPSAVNGFTVTLTSQCTVTNVSTGVSFTFAGLASFPVTVDVLNETVVDSAGNNWITGLTHAGSRAWMVVQPDSQTISVSAGTATFTWNDAYL